MMGRTRVPRVCMAELYLCRVIMSRRFGLRGFEFRGLGFRVESFVRVWGLGFRA